MDEYMTASYELTPEELQWNIKSLRRCQAYIATLPDGETREDLKNAVSMAFDMVGIILGEHGIEAFEDRVSFEAGDFSKWIENKEEK